MKRLHRLAILALLAGLAACGATSSPDDRPVPTRTDAEIIATLQSRTACRSLYAVVTVAYDSSEVHGTFKAVAQFKAPGQIRITAFKDVPVVSSGSIFDLLITREVFALAVAPQEGHAAVIDHGPTRELSERHQGFLGFEVAREALFLPGKFGSEVVARRPHAILVTGSVPGEPEGSVVDWALDARTLEVTHGYAGILYSGFWGKLPVAFDYAHYREVGGISVPEDIEYAYDSAGIRMKFHLLDVEVNPPLDDSFFDPASVVASPR